MAKKVKGPKGGSSKTSMSTNGKGSFGKQAASTTGKPSKK